jgi:hypothetical protein
MITNPSKNSWGQAAGFLTALALGVTGLALPSHAADPAPKPAASQTLKPAATPKPTMTPKPAVTPKPVAKPAAMPEPAAPTAAAMLTGQCRAVNKQTALYKDRSTTSAVVLLLKAEDKVTLAEESAQNGLMAVSSPGKGYVAPANLKMCPGAKPKPDPKPTDGSSCRVVIQKLGLVVRKDADIKSEVLGGVALNEKVTLVSSMESKTVDGRNWTHLAKPDGWVSDGFDGAVGKNLGTCP